MNEFAQAFLTDLFCAFAEYEEKTVENVALAAAVGSYDCCETFVEWTDFLNAGIGFEVLENHSVNYETCAFV